MRATVDLPRFGFFSMQRVLSKMSGRTSRNSRSPRRSRSRSSSSGVPMAALPVQMPADVPQAAALRFSQDQAITDLRSVLPRLFPLGPDGGGLPSNNAHEFGCFASAVVNVLADYAQAMTPGAFTYTPADRDALLRIQRKIVAAHNSLAAASRKTLPCARDHRAATPGSAPPGCLKANALPL